MGGVVDPRRAVAIALLLACAPGCAIINAAGAACTEDEFECCADGDDNDGDGETDCDDPNCFGTPECGSGQCDEDAPAEDLGTFPVASIALDTCEGTQIERSDLGSFGLACDTSDSVVLYKFTNTATGPRLICIDYQVTGRVGVAADPCGIEEGTCADANDTCRPFNLGPRDYYIQVASAPGDCGPLTLSIQEMQAAEICDNGADDNARDGTDCEDPQCQPRVECTHPLGEPMEFCNGEDDGDVMTFPPGSIDELACRCVTDSGCNDIESGTLPPYICHPDVPGGGVCGPPCDLGNWCLPFGLTCVNGRCE